MHKRLLAVFLSTLVFMLAIPIVHADCGCSEPDEVDSVSIDFQCDTFSLSWSHGSGIGSVLIVMSSDSSILMLDSFDSPFGSLVIPFSPPMSTDNYFIVVIGIFDDVDPDAIAISFFIVSCDEVPVASGADYWACGDGRLNFIACDMLAVYPNTSEDGTAWTIYYVPSGSSEGRFALYIPASVFNSLPATIDENCTIGKSESGHVVVYRLSSGQYQVNVGPDYEGKIFEYIFNDLASQPISITNFVSGMLPEVLPACPIS